MFWANIIYFNPLLVNKKFDQKYLIKKYEKKIKQSLTRIIKNGIKECEALFCYFFTKPHKRAVNENRVMGSKVKNEDFKTNSFDLQGAFIPELNTSSWYKQNTVTKNYL